MNYFFRDIDNEGNLEYGVSFHGAGIVENIYETDLLVSYIDPFTLEKCTECRTRDEVCLFEVRKCVYDELKQKYDNYDKI